MLKQFHFLEPLWLLALLPLMLILWLVFQKNTDSRAWEKIIDASLLPLLLQGEDNNTSKLPKLLLAMVWIVTIIALADPVWEKIPRPIFQTNAARILVLDLSNSMLIEDVKPSRLARARFKIEDILSREEEGQTGLVLFAGEGFTASPLTRDTETIRSLLKVLTPQIMPSQGSRADLGLIKAHELLKQAGTVNGQVLLIADGVSRRSATLSAAVDLRNDGHTVSVMAVGTEAGGRLNFRNNTSQTIKLDAQSLTNIAISGAGNYHLLTTNDTDLKHLLSPISDNSSLEEKQNTKADKQEIQNREWRSTGPLLILFLLPFAALAFRRGWLLNIAVAFLAVGFLFQPQEIMAAESDLQKQEQTNWQGFVEKLSKNKAQRANQALINQQYEKARDLSDEPLARGSAEYKLESYEEALHSFKQVQGADARYNEGNTLAKLEKYEEAIAAYDKALKFDSSMQDAIDNKKAIEDFLKKQKSDKKDESSDEDQESSSDSKDDKQDGSQSSDKGEEKDKEEENKSESGDKSEDENSKAEEEQQVADQDEKSAAEEANKQEGKELAEELSKEEKMAAEQWLRRIPDDPGGLLRRKFRHQLEQSRRDGKPISKENPW